MTMMEETARQWMKSRDIIAKALKDLGHIAQFDDGAANDQAALIIARLASCNPPLLIFELRDIKS